MSIEFVDIVSAKSECPLFRQAENVPFLEEKRAVGVTNGSIFLTVIAVPGCTVEESLSARGLAVIFLFKYPGEREGRSPLVRRQPRLWRRRRPCGS
jgi:hypothetical protein